MAQKLTLEPSRVDSKCTVQLYLCQCDPLLPKCGLEKVLWIAEYVLLVGFFFFSLMQHFPFLCVFNKLKDFKISEILLHHNFHIWDFIADKPLKANTAAFSLTSIHLRRHISGLRL